MKIFRVNFHLPSFYGDADAEVKGAAVKQRLEELIADLPTARKEEAPYKCQYLMSEKDLLTVLSTVEVYSYGNEPSIEKVELVMDIADPMKAVRPLLERMELAASRLTADAGQAPAPAFNSHTNSPIPGPHLLGISRVMIAEDCCTDRLQELLDEGWRLIAICPQEARRPDYVLGRYGEFGAKYGSAGRGEG